MSTIRCKYCEAKVDATAAGSCPSAAPTRTPRTGVTPPRTRPAAGVACVRCPGELLHFGTQKLRFGGSDGVWKLAFGELAELGESAVPVEVLVCEQCRSMEFRLSPEVK